MKKRKDYAVLFLLFVLVTSKANTQTSPLFNYIPEKATTVIHIDLLRLKDKLPAGDFKQSLVYRELTKDPHSPLPALLNDPAKTGIDFTAGVLIAVRNSGQFTQPGSGTSLFFKLKNQETFAAFLKEMQGTQKPDAEMNGEENGIRVYGTDHILLSDYKMSLGWNNDVLVMTSEPSRFFLNSVSVQDTVTISFTDSTGTTVPDPGIASPAEQAKARFIAQKEQRNLIFGLLTPRPQNPLLTDAQFAELMSKAADARIWSDESREKALPSLMGGPAAILKKMQQFGAKTSTAVLNFENGRIVMNGKNFPSPSIARLYKDFKISPQNGELLRKLPPANVIGLMSISLDPQVMKNIMQVAGLKKMMADMQNDLPVKINAELLAGAFKPNMLMALLNSEKQIPDSLTSKKGGFDFLLAIPIADKSKFEALKNQWLPLIDSMKTNDPGKLKGAPIVKYNEEMMVLSLSPATAAAFLYNPAPGEAPAWIHEFSQYPVVMNFNFNKLFLKLMKSGKGSKEEMQPFINIMDQVYFYGGNYNNGAIEMNMEFRFADKEKNALVQLLALVNQMK